MSIENSSDSEAMVMKKCLFALNDEQQSITVMEDGDIRYLIFGREAVQSRVSLKHPYRLLIPYLKSLLLTQKFVPEASHVLILGLGGGAMIHYLTHNYPHLHITCVESNALIIKLAKKYFAVNDGLQRVNIVEQTAQAYLKQCTTHFDAIYVDIYPANTVHTPINMEFLYQLCNKRLSMMGVIGCNHVCYSQQHVHNAFSACRNVFHDHTLMCPVANTMNLVMIASNTATFSKKCRQLNSQNKIRIKHDSPTYGYVAEYD